MKRAQAALRDSEALRRLAVALRDTRDAILVQEMTGRVISVSVVVVGLANEAEESDATPTTKRGLPV